MRPLLRLLSIAPQSPRLLRRVVLSQTCGGLLAILQAFLLSKLVGESFLAGRPLSALWVLVGAGALTIALRAFALWQGGREAAGLAACVKESVRLRLFERVLALGPLFTRRRQTGELTAVLMEGVENLDAFFVHYLPQVVVTAVVPLGILLVVFSFDWVSGLVFLLTAPLLPLFMVLIGKAGESLTRRQWDTLSRLSAHFLDSIQGLMTLKLFRRARAHAKTVDEVSEQFRVVTTRVLRVTFLSALVLELFTAISTALVAVEVSLRLLSGSMAFQSAFFILLLAPEFYLPLRMLALRFHAGMNGRTAAGQILAILDDQAPEIVAEDTQGARSVPQAVVFEAVSFSYPGEERPSLQQTSFVLEAGQRLAVVGRSGAGKSTLIGLLLGFLRPDVGKIYTRYRDGSIVPAPPPLSMVSWVPQNPYLFHDTIAANIRLARPSADDEEIMAAARAAHLDEFVRSLPQGYQTLIGEGGARLSAGQAQRLALARAFLKDAPILILDEATGSLDPREEALIMDAVHRLMRGKMVLIVAHRLVTVRDADCILVMEDGRIVERGSHATLLAADGVYARLVSALQDPFESKNPLPAPSDREPARPSLRQEEERQPSFSADRGRSLSVLMRLLGFLREGWRWIALSVVLGVLTVGSNIGLMGLASWLISAAALRPPLGDLQLAIVGVRFFGLARAVLRYAERLASHEVTFRLLARLRGWFYRALEPLAPARLMYYRSGDLLNRIVADVETLENFYGRALAPCLVAWITAAGQFVFLYRLAPALAFVNLFFFLCAGVGVSSLALRAGYLSGDRLIAQRAALRSALVDGMQGMAELLVFERRTSYSQYIARLDRELNNTQKQATTATANVDALQFLVIQGGAMVSLAVAVMLLGRGAIDGLMVAPLFLVALTGLEASAALPSAAQTWMVNLQAGKRLFGIVDEPSEEGEAAHAGRPLPTSALHESPSSHPPVIEFRRLTFSYAPVEEPVLRDVSFSLPPGGRLAIVGPSGAGKSTLLHLLLRFWQPPFQTVFLNGRDIREFDEDEVRGLFGVAPQSPFFFCATVRENLLLASPTASSADLEWALEQVQLRDFIARLPTGLDTVIGERGLRLSAGERQRLSLARALLTRAPILVLDEPTANLDALNERLILDSLRRLPRTQSLVLITHRLVALEDMDEILVLDEGRIVERGSHAELLSRRGLYASMFALQQRIFAD